MGNCCSERKNQEERQQATAIDKNLILTKDDCFIPKYNSLFMRGSAILSRLDSIKQQYTKQLELLLKAGDIIDHGYDWIIHGIAGFIWGVAVQYRLEGNPNGFKCEVLNEAPYLKIELNVDPDRCADYIDFHKHLDKLLMIINSDREKFAQEVRNYKAFLAEASEEVRHIGSEAAAAETRGELNTVNKTRAIENTQRNFKIFKEKERVVDEILKELEAEHQKYVKQMRVLKNAVAKAHQKAESALAQNKKSLSEVLALFMNDPDLKYN